MRFKASSCKVLQIQAYELVAILEAVREAEAQQPVGKRTEASIEEIFYQNVRAILLAHGTVLN